MEAPKVAVSRDFDLQKLDGAQVGQYMSNVDAGRYHPSNVVGDPATR